MMYRPHPRSSRAGFSLIELLIVVVVISILAALIAAAVIRAQVVGERTQAVAEINQLAMMAKEFETAYGVFPPDGGLPMATDNDAAALKVLQKMYPRNLGSFMPPSGMNGNAALVYFLRGPDGTGWSSSAPGPAGTGSKKGPFFDFPANRLVGGQFVDPWGTPYAYFRSTKGSGYTSGSQSYTNNKESPPLTSSISPLMQTATKPINIDGVQIISAGPDARFGSGGIWSPGSGDYSGSGPGADDIANHNGGTQLGTNPN